MATLLRNLRPIGLTGEIDLVVGEDGRILPPGSPAATVVDGGGAFVSAGWVDLHQHVYWGATDISIRASDGGARTGVTTIVDAGSAGEANFHGFRGYVIEPSLEQVLAFLNIGSIGLVACNRVSELIDARSIDVDRTLDVIEANRDVVRGVKVRASGVILGAWGMTPVHVAKKVARVTGLPLMVHVGEMPPTIEEILDVLTPGDIVTHCFHGKRGGNLLEDPALFERARRMQADGVVLDIGHGFASFAYDTARRALDMGLKPTTISTDLHARNIGGPVWDLPLVMSKLLVLGLALEEVVGMVTDAARRAVAEPVADPFAPGAFARLTVFDVCDADLTLPDSMGRTLRLDRRIRPRMTVIGDRIVEAGSNLPFAAAGDAF
jgi:dihydroorotase